MHGFKKGLHVVLFLAASCLVLNDMVRLAFPWIQQMTLSSNDQEQQEEENAPISAPNLLEEEVKHHEPHHYLESFSFHDDDAGQSKGHLIQDDDISVLAFITIFSPPPNCA